MLNAILNRLMWRMKLAFGMVILSAIFGVFSHRAAPPQQPTQASNPWANNYAAQPAAAPASYATPAYSAHRGGYDEEARKDEEFRRRMLRELREASEREETQGVNAPDYHPN